MSEPGASPVGVRRYQDARLHQQVSILLPGFVHVTSELEYISTVLGTCIAVCLYDRERCFGGMNHFMLPETGGHGLHAEERICRYGEHAMPQLLFGMKMFGARNEDLCAKVFGGARVAGDRHGIGRANREYAMDFLERQGIPVIAESSGGVRARQVLFDPTFGHARVRFPGGMVVPAEEDLELALFDREMKPESFWRLLEG